MKIKKAGLFRTALYLLEGVIAISGGTLLSFFPRRLFPGIAALLGAAVFRLDRKDRHYAYENLNIVFKDAPLSKIEKDRIIKAVFASIVQVALEFLQLKKIIPETLPKFLTAANPHVVEEALRERKGVLLITAHLGNWEYLGILSSMLGYRGATILKHQHNPYTDRWLTKLREKNCGVRCLYRGKGLHYRIGAHLKRNGIVAVLADQRDVSSSLVVPFFGGPSVTANGPAVLHLWYGAPIVFAFCIRQRDGRYIVTFDGPYYFKTTGDHQADVYEIMNFINLKYASVIRKHPEQWLSLLTPRWRMP